MFNAGSSPEYLGFDGANIWVANLGSNNVTELNEKAGATLGTSPADGGPVGIAFDGSSIWIANSVARSVNKR